MALEMRMFYNRNMKNMKWLSAALSAGTFAVLYFYERRRPLRRQIEQKEIQTARNLAIASAAGAASFLIENPVADTID
jgi:hypothetical protein